MLQIYKKTPMPNFNKYAFAYLLKRHFLAWVFSRKCVQIFRPPFYKNTSGGSGSSALYK